MAKSLAHTKWMCKYHIVFTPKYRRKIVTTQAVEISSGKEQDQLSRYCSLFFKFHAKR